MALIPLLLALLLITLIPATRGLAATTSRLFAERPATSISLQGFSGILNSPTAHIQEEGTLETLYSNQKDLFGQRTPRRQENYLFSVGLFNFLEIGGRLTEAPDIARDLSLNAKFSTSALTAKLPFAPALALGFQDVGGGASHFRTTYLSASAEPLSWLRLSTGYGWGPDRMQGKFGGIEIQAHKYLALLGEYDTRNTNVGIRLSTPPLAKIPLKLSFVSKTSLNDTSNFDVAFGLSMPLNLKSAATTPGFKPSKSTEPQEAEKPRINVRTPPTLIENSEPQAPSRQQKQGSPARAEGLASLNRRLIAAGFANVRVGTLAEATLVVEYENVRYHHNELDGLGIVAGLSAQAEVEGLKRLTLVIKRKGLRMLLVSAPIKELRTWLADPEFSLPPVFQVNNDSSAVDAALFIDAAHNPDWLRPSLILSPGLKTFVGTESGVFDYLLAIKPELQMTTWKGAVLNARWDLPLTWSDSFDDGGSFAYARNDAVLDRLMLFQGVSLTPTLMANLGGGLILPDIKGTLNELVWSPKSGIHRFRLGQSYARNSLDQTDLKVVLGSYRRYFPALDLFVEGTAGKFWGQDTGGLLTLKRFFGDTAIDLYYKNTETPAKKRWQAAGMQISFPLTPRRDMKRAPVQIRGNEEWGYSQEMVLAINGQRTNDTISTTLGINPIPSPSIYRSYQNRDRLNEAYILAHSQRLKDAWIGFKDNTTEPWAKF